MTIKMPAISAPWGGGMNHVRWMVLLDQKYFKSNNIFSSASLDDKVNFISKQVYGKNKTWNTWIHLEDQLRMRVGELMPCFHQMWDWRVRHNEYKKILFLRFNDPQKLVDHYFHINLAMNSLTPGQFLQDINQWQLELDAIQAENLPNVKILVSDTVHQDILDPNWYQELMDWFGCDNNYKHVAQIHHLYHQRRRQSALEFHNYFTGNEFHQYLELMKQLGNTPIDVLE